MDKLKDVISMKNRKGITLVELLLAVALISLIIVPVTNFLLLGVKSHAITIDEFNIQSNTRLVSQKINSVIRDASAVFVLHREDDEMLTQEWNYIMLNEDHTKLLEYHWNDSSKTHEVIELVTGIYDVNALQVVDRSYLNLGNALAYRYDSRIGEASNAQAVVSMVLDRSGSMDDNMQGNSTSTTSAKRITKMKAEAVRLVEALSKNTNINISIIPFSSTANNPGDMLSANKNLSSIKSTINALTASGGTNTGDAIRRGYYQIKNFNEKEENKNRTNKNFMIILVDGVTTFASVNKVNEIVSTPIDQGNNYTIDGYTYGRHSTQYNSIYFYYDAGDTYNDGNYDYTKYGSKTEKGSTSFQGNRGEDLYSGSAYKGSSYDQTVRGNLRTYEYDRYTSSGSGSNRRYTYYYKYYEYEYRRYNYRYNGVKSEDYVTGDNNINNSEAGNNVDYRPDGRYAGKGNSLDPWGTEYVNMIGDMVKEYKEGTNEAIQVYVIGFSAKTADLGSLGDIAMATRGDNVFYEAGDEKALETIFKAIQRDITDALWHIGGPN